MRIPFCLFSVPVAKRFSRKFFFATRPFLKMNPSLDMTLEKAGYDIEARTYVAMAVISFVVIYLFSLRLAFSGLAYGALAGLAIFFMIVMYTMKFPRVVIAKKSRDLERNMIYAMKHLLVQVKSGVPLFSALVSVSEKDYGQMSVEIKQLIKQVETGIPLENAMDKLAMDTTSEHFRRALWQLSNSLKSGVEVSSTVRTLIEGLVHDQRIAIRRYGAQLNPLTLVYMMVAVILPALGITLMIVMSSFSGTAVPKSMFYVLIFAVTSFQFMFIGMIKSKRPAL